MSASLPVLERAQALLMAGRPAEALTQLGALPADEAVSTVAMLIRCVALGRLRRWPEVGEAARAGLAAGGPHPGLLLWLARSEQEAGRPAAAERALLDGLALAPADVELLCGYAELCALEGQTDKAGRLVDLAAAQAPQAALVFATRIHVAHARGDHQAAERISREFVAEHPESPAAHALFGGASAARGRIDEAYAGFRQAAAAMPTEQAFADAALDLRIARHPLMRPLRPVIRFGVWKTWLAALAVIYGLRVLGLVPLSHLASLVWVVYCVYSWVVPPLVRRRVRRAWH